MASEGVTGLIKTDIMNSSYYIEEMFKKNENPLNCNISCCNNNYKINAEDVRLFFIKHKINKIDKII